MPTAAGRRAPGGPPCVPPPAASVTHARPLRKWPRRTRPAQLGPSGTRRPRPVVVPLRGMRGRFRGADSSSMDLFARPATHAVDRGGSPRLTRRFALLSGLALLVAASLALLLARHNATTHARGDVWAAARFVADRLGRDDLAGSAFRGPAGADLR